MTELQHQQALIKWTQQPSVRKTYPELKLLFHIPNERQCTPAQGAQLKRAGVKRGVPDLFLPAARQDYHGLFVEMKTPMRDESEYQEWWIYELASQGYCARVCHGFEDARRTLEWYLTLKN